MLAPKINTNFQLNNQLTLSIFIAAPEKVETVADHFFDAHGDLIFPEEILPPTDLDINLLMVEPDDPYTEPESTLFDISTFLNPLISFE